MNPDVTRRLLIARTSAALGASALAPSATDARSPAVAQATPGSPVPVRSLVHRGIDYDVGTEYVPGYTSRPESHRAYLRQELEVIRTGLHCTSVGLYGSDPDRLIEATAEALDLGLDVRVQPRRFHTPSDRLGAELAGIATAVSELAGSEREMVFDLGCELTLFSDAAIPGETFEERAAHLVANLGDIPEFNTRLNDLLGELASAVRPVFDGRLTYSSGEWEGIDWTPLDIVGVDLYRDANNEAGYVQRLRWYLDQGKPVWITEFGTCSYVGAGDLGGSAYDIVDYSTTPPTIAGDVTRDEATQTSYITDLLDLYTQEGVDGAFVFHFIEPEYPHDPETPRNDLDMAAYSIVRTFGASAPKPYESTGYWEPKEAFAAIAGRYQIA